MNRVENLRKFTYLSNPKTNSDQSLAAFVVSNCDLDNDRYKNKIYTFNGTELRPLTEAGEEASFCFEDAENILFKSPSKNRYQNDKAKDTQAPCSHYFRIAVDGGEASYAFSIPLAVDQLLPLNERNKFLVLASYDIDLPDLWQKAEAEQNAIMEKRNKPRRPHMINEIPFQANGQGYLYGKRSALFMFDALTKELELIGSDYPNYVINWITLNPSKTKAAFAATPYTGDDKFRWQPFARLYELDLQSEIITPLYAKLDQQLGDGFYIETVDQNGKATGEEALVLISSDTLAYGINQNNHFYLYDRTAKDLHKLSDYEIIYGSSVGSDVCLGYHATSYQTDSTVYNLIETKGYSSKLTAFSFVKEEGQKLPSLKQETLVNKEGACLAAFKLNIDTDTVLAANDCAALDAESETDSTCDFNSTSQCQVSDITCTCADSNAAYTACNCAKDCLFVIGLYGQELNELYLVTNPTNLIRLTYFNDHANLELTAIKPEKLTYTSPYDQSEMTGFVLLPPDFESGKLASYPLIMDIHGGPKTVYGTTYYHEMQVWANLGFVVCFTNPHGSDGYGNDFADIRGAYGNCDFDDLMAFLDCVLAKYKEVDQARLGVTGGSYGGFMTNWIITHTDCFKVACSQRSISNWLSFYGTSDIGYYFATDQNKVKGLTLPEQAILWEHSPLKHINNAVTPTLFIHSDSDYRCPLEQGMQMHTALLALGVTSKLCIFPGENHELSRSGKPQAREWRLNLMTHWFLKYLQADKVDLINEFAKKIE